MTEFPPLAGPNRLESLLNKIGSLGVPDKVTVAWLQSVGHKSSNDRSLPKALEFIDFVDASRKPTEKWKGFLSKKNSGKILADAIRESYEALYKVYPDAHQRSDDDLIDFFKTETLADDEKVARIVKTFKTLCSLADFDKIQDEEIDSRDGGGEEPVGQQPMHPQPPPKTQTPSLHIDIQIHIPSDASPEQIDRIFASMAKHLYNTADDSP